jgi:hypothetical protein
VVSGVDLGRGLIWSSNFGFLRKAMKYRSKQHWGRKKKKRKKKAMSGNRDEERGLVRVTADGTWEQNGSIGNVDVEYLS